MSIKLFSVEFDLPLRFKATKYLMYDETHKWLILGQNLNDTVSLINDDAFSVMTDVTIAVPSLTGYDLYDVYNPCKERGGTLNMTALGYWTEKSGVAIKLKQSKFERRSNLQGMKLKVGILVSDIFDRSERISHTTDSV